MFFMVGAAKLKAGKASNDAALVKCISFLIQIHFTSTTTVPEVSEAICCLCISCPHHATPHAKKHPGRFTSSQRKLDELPGRVVGHLEQHASKVYQARPPFATSMSSLRLWRIMPALPFTF